MSNPVKTCKSQVYKRTAGEGRSAGANAFGKCVSTIAKHKAENDGKESSESHGKNRANPARACKVMRTNDLAQFQTVYGSRPNAFGKCVSGHANTKG